MLEATQLECIIDALALAHYFVGAIVGPGRRYHLPPSRSFQGQHCKPPESEQVESAYQVRRGSVGTLIVFQNVLYGLYHHLHGLLKSANLSLAAKQSFALEVQIQVSKTSTNKGSDLQSIDTLHRWYAQAVHLYEGRIRLKGTSSLPCVVIQVEETSAEMLKKNQTKGRLHSRNTISLQVVHFYHKKIF